MRTSLWWGFILGALLVAPSALAAPSGGYFVSEGPILLPPRSHIEGTPLGLFMDTLDGLSAFELKASEARIHIAEKTYFVTRTPAGDEVWFDGTERLDTLALTDVRITSGPFVGEVGWIGGYFSSDSVAGVTSAVPTEIKPGGVSQIGHDNRPLVLPTTTPGDPVDPRNRHYYMSVVEDHFGLTTRGAFDVQGPATWKLLGPTFSVSSRETSREIVTGKIEDGGAVPRIVFRWIVVEAPEGGASFLATEDVDLLYDSGTAVGWSGPARFAPLRGQLSSEDETYTAGGGPITLDGEFTSLLTPRRESGRLLTSMSLTGTLAGTTLTPQAVAAARAPGGADASFWLPLLLFGAVVVAGSTGAAYAVARRRRVAPMVRAPVSPDVVAVDDDGLQADDCMRFADEAAAERRWARALHWAQRARKLAPHNARVRADEGEYLYQLGLFEEALQALGEASRLDDAEGYADYRGAQAAVSAGRPMDEVLGWLTRALDRSPDLVGDLELFREFDVLRGDPRYDEMVLKAYERLGIDPAPQA